MMLLLLVCRAFIALAVSALHLHAQAQGQDADNSKYLSNFLEWIEDGGGTMSVLAGVHLIHTPTL